jgi:hypothetical protein
MKSLLIAGIALLASTSLVLAQATITVITPNNSAPISIAGAGIVQLVPAIPGRTIVVTSRDFTFSGGTGTFEFIYGTGINCGTNPHPLTGAYSSGITGAAGDTDLFVPSGNALCAVTTGTTNIAGAVAYLQ